jgi:hypothetical protein
MTQSRQALHPSSAAQVAAVALGKQGVYGVVTDLAREHGLRRERVYELRDRGRVALETAFAEDRSAAGAPFMLQMSEADLKRAVVLLRVVTPASIRDIVELLPLLLGQRMSYGSVWNTLHEAERRAAEWLAQVDLSGVTSVALDEMFSQRRPVMAGIDLDTGFLVQLEVHEDRSGETWARALGALRDGQGLNPARVVKDAGSGLAAGVRLAWPEIVEHDDLFHAVYAMGREASHVERRAYATIGAVDDLEKRRAKARDETRRRSLGQQLRQARDWMEQCIERFDRFEELQREATRVLELSDPGCGRLRTSKEVVEVLTAVALKMKALGTKRIRKVATYLHNRAEGLGRYLDELSRRLDEVTDVAGGSVIVEAVVRAYQANLAVSKRAPSWERRARKDELRAAAAHLIEVSGRDPQRVKDAFDAVIPILVHRHRASSAIENLNSVLRPYLVVQKHAEPGFLKLFQFYWNTRTRQWGRWKGTSAYELLSGEHVPDWASLIDFPPSGGLAAAA